MDGACLLEADLSGALHLTIDQVLAAEEWAMDVDGEGFEDDDHVPTRFPPDIEKELTRRGLRNRIVDE